MRLSRDAVRRSYPGRDRRQNDRAETVKTFRKNVIAKRCVGDIAVNSNSRRSRKRQEADEAIGSVEIRRGVLGVLKIGIEIREER